MHLWTCLEIPQLEVTRLRRPPECGQVQAQLMCHTSQDTRVETTLKTTQTGGLRDMDHTVHTAVLTVTFSCSPCYALRPFCRLGSLVTKLISCFCTVLHGRHKSGSRERAHTVQLPAACRTHSLKYQASGLQTLPQHLDIHGINVPIDPQQGKFQDTNQIQRDQVLQEHDTSIVSI